MPLESIRGTLKGVRLTRQRQILLELSAEADERVVGGAPVQVPEQELAASSRHALEASVQKGPAMMALTRTVGPNSSANALVSTLRPAFAAA